MSFTKFFQKCFVETFLYVGSILPQEVINIICYTQQAEAYEFLRLSTWRDRNGNTLLHKEARKGNMIMMHALLNCGIGINEENAYGQTPLLYANYNLPHVIEFLLVNGADLTATNNLYQSPLHLAALAGNLDSVILLLKYGMDVNAIDHRDQSALHIAVESSNMEMTETLLKWGANVNSTESSLSILSLAARTRNEEMVKLLLDHGADVQYESIDGTSPLHFAVWLKDTQIALRMIEQGADINKQDADGFGILHEAVYEGNLGQVQMLLDLGADIHIKTLEGDTPLHWAAFGNIPDSYEIIALLLKHGANCNDGDVDESTPFHFILKKADLQVIRMFLLHGADISSRNYRNECAIHFAAENPNIEVIHFVLACKFDVNSVSVNGFTALHYAAESGNMDGCSLLLKRGARVNVVCDEGRSPLYLTARIQQVEPIQMLLDYGANVFEKTVQGESIVDVIHEHKNVPVRDVILRHIAKLETMGHPIDESDRQVIQNDPDFKAFYDKCLADLDYMKNNKFYNNISFYTMLVENIKVIIGYARNEELVKAFDENYVERSEYDPWLKRRFVKEVKIQRLRRAAFNCLNNIFHNEIPNQEVIEKIVDYIDEKNLGIYSKYS